MIITSVTRKQAGTSPELQRTGILNPESEKHDYNESSKKTVSIWSTYNIKQDLRGNVEILKNKKQLSRLTRSSLEKNLWKLHWHYFNCPFDDVYRSFGMDLNVDPVTIKLINGAI